MPKSSLTLKSELLTVMANPHRLKVLMLLLGGEVAAGTLTQKVGMGQSAMSQHLTKLRSAELVTSRREGQAMFYSISSDKVAKLLATLDDIFDKKKAIATRGLQ